MLAPFLLLTFVKFLADRAELDQTEEEFVLGLYSLLGPLSLFKY